jgi:four helix bundle protein
MSNGYKNLKVWNKGYALTLKTYNKTKSYPKNEMYGITSQLRRASASIIANIAEGYARDTRKDYTRFISIAISSSNELEVFLELSKDLNYLNKKDFEDLYTNNKEIMKMLLGLRKSLKIKA